jgi:hypothetical protein
MLKMLFIAVATLLTLPTIYSAQKPPPCIECDDFNTIKIKNIINHGTLGEKSKLLIAAASKGRIGIVRLILKNFDNVLEAAKEEKSAYDQIKKVVRGAVEIAYLEAHRNKQLSINQYLIDVACNGEKDNLENIKNTLNIKTVHFVAALNKKSDNAATSEIEKAFEETLLDATTNGEKEIVAYLMTEFKPSFQTVKRALQCAITSQKEEIAHCISEYLLHKCKAEKEQEQVNVKETRCAKSCG